MPAVGPSFSYLPTAPSRDAETLPLWYEFVVGNWLLGECRHVRGRRCVTTGSCFVRGFPFASTLVVKLFGHASTCKFFYLLFGGRPPLFVPGPSGLKFFLACRLCPAGSLFLFLSFLCSLWVPELLCSTFGISGPWNVKILPRLFMTCFTTNMSFPLSKLSSVGCVR